MKIKRIMTATLAAVLLLASLSLFSSCGSNYDYTIGITQADKHPALDDATRGFRDAVEEKFGKDKVKFIELIASGNDTVSANAQQLVSKKVDLILANATGALTAAASATTTIPILGTSITDYSSALEIKAEDWNGKTGRNISGTSDLAPLDEQAALVKQFFPNAKKVGVLYCNAEPNSLFQYLAIKPILEEMGYEVKSYTFNDSNDVTTVTESACDNSDVLYIPTDNTAAKSIGSIKNVLTRKNTPMIAGESGICSAGVATLSINYYDLGYRTGLMAYEVLVEGKDIATLEIAYLDKFAKLFNVDVAATFDITMPEGFAELPKSED